MMFPSKPRKHGWVKQRRQEPERHTDEGAGSHDLALPELSCRWKGAAG